MPVADNTLMLLLKGYGWLPDLRRRAPKGIVRTRILGQRTVGLCGPDAARFFYDEANVERGAALPGPIKSTLFGHGSVHSLDGEAHRVRKAMFTSMFSEQAIADLVERTAMAWDHAVAGWAGRPVVLFDETSQVLTAAVCRWAGLSVSDEEIPSLAADLVAMVDGWGTLGPRHWRARRARRHREAWLERLIQDLRAEGSERPSGTAAEAVATHTDSDGRRLDPHAAAVELLNVIRPTVAVCWFVAFAGHALHRWPRNRARLAGGDRSFAQAFAHEVRRFYPFAPMLGGRAVRDLVWEGEPIPAGTLVLLDVYGQNHDPHLWAQPYTFDPQRFVDRPPGAFDLIPQGGGHPGNGHRCPGEDLAVALLEMLGPRLARLDYTVPDQDLSIPLRRLPTRPVSGFVFTLTSLAPPYAPSSHDSETRVP